MRSSRHNAARSSSCFFGMLVLRSRRLRSSALTSAASSRSALARTPALGQLVLVIGEILPGGVPGGRDLAAPDGELLGGFHRAQVRVGQQRGEPFGLAIRAMAALRRTR